MGVHMCVQKRVKQQRLFRFVAAVGSRVPSAFLPAMMVVTAGIAAISSADDQRTEQQGTEQQRTEQQGEEETNRWVQLFDGRSLEGWTAKINGYPLGVNYSNTFRVENGLLTVAYDDHAYPSFDRRFGHLIYRRPFSAYLLRAEYRFIGTQAANGPAWATRNSGIMVHGQSPESMTEQQEFPNSIEVQLLGGLGEDRGDRPTANLCTPGTHVVIDGQLWKQHCLSSSSKTYHGDQWVTVEIEVRGSTTIKHRIDGDVVLEYTQPQLDDGTLLRTGWISLQSESHPIQFRKVELLELKD